MVPLEPRRRAVVLALAGILAGFAFETGVLVETATTDRVVLPSSELPVADRRSTLDVHPLGAHRRRPPSILA